MDDNHIKIKIAIELIMNEVQRLAEFDSNDVLQVVNDSLDSLLPAPAFAEVIQNQYVLDLIMLEKNKSIPLNFSSLN